MDITRYNFEEEFDNIKTVIEEATFLAFDGEFSGLRLESSDKISPFDTPAERYRKERDACSNFLLLQFGLCAFKAVEAEKRYEARPYNFYLFPRPQNEQQSPDRRFTCQSSSIDFLVSNNFDFNKLFKEGIPYLTYAQENKLREDLEKKFADQSNVSLNGSMTSPNGPQHCRKTVVPKEYEGFISQIRAQVEAYLKSDETEPLALPPYNNFQRKLIYQLKEDDYPLLFLETKTGEKKQRYLQMSKCASKDDLEKTLQKKQNLELMKLDIQLGFTKVMKLITESGKLLVGHNMILDVIHSVNHFYYSAPQELTDFKDMISSIFPRLIDTKLMANTSPYKDYFMGTSLDELRYTLKNPPFKAVEVELPEGFTNYNEGGKFHEAGYDAYVTGVCFASMINFLGRFQNPQIGFVLPTDHIIKPMVNKLYLMRLSDIPYINLCGPDVKPTREHVFHVTFPEEWKSTDLQCLFEPYGNVQISWLTATTAYVGLYRKENANLAKSALCQKNNGNFQVITYELHKRMVQMNNNNTTSTPTPTPTSTLPAIKSSQTKQADGAGTKRPCSTSISDETQPPVKVSKSLINESNAYNDDDEEDDEEDEEEEDEDEDLGVPLTRKDSKKQTEEIDMIEKDAEKTAEEVTSKDLPKTTTTKWAEDSRPTQTQNGATNNRKLFEEPDW